MGLQGLLSDYGGDADFMRQMDESQRFDFRNVQNPRNRLKQNRSMNPNLGIGQGGYFGN